MTDHSPQEDFVAMRKLATPALRQLVRSGEYRGHTAGLAAGKLQVNLAILPEAYAPDFLQYCRRNPKPCPLVGVSKAGSPLIEALGHDLDVRTDAPGYYVYRDGQRDEAVSDISHIWRDDLVAFALGCSFTFENALLDAGIPVWHIANNTTVPMFQSRIETHRSGLFGGGTVVSMRAIDTDRIDEVSAISAKFPQAHGAPVHIGNPSAIGISDLANPDWGDPAPVGPGQTPVFWACGVTPQAAIMHARLPLCITHEPGKMLVTDVSDTSEITIETN